MPTPLTIKQWATYRLLLTVNGVSGPLDLSGFRVEAMVRAKYLDLIPVVTFTVTPTGSAGQVEAVLTELETGRLKHTGTKPTYFYDFVLINAATDERTRLVEGTVTVSPGVTHDA